MSIIDVLLVEDDEGEAFVIARLLGEAVDVRFTVAHVTTLKSCLQYLELRKPDIVLLDLSLPDFHGYDTVVEYTKHAETPFLVLTGNDDMHMAARSMGLGAQDYVLKNDLQARKLEMSILLAVRRHNAQTVSRKLEHSSRTLVFDGNETRATLSMVRPHIEELIAAIEDLEDHLRRNAPNTMDDVEALLKKHHVHPTIREVQSILRLQKEVRPTRSRSISEQAIQMIAGVVTRRQAKDSEAPRDFSTAEADLLDVINRREGGNG